MALRISPLSKESEIEILAPLMWRQWGQKTGQTLEERITLLRVQLQDNRFPYRAVAYWDGALCGSAALIEDDLDDVADINLTPWLASVFVLPEFRRRGIAQALVDHILKTARGLPFDKIYLYTPDQQALYEKSGFTWQFDLDYHGEVISIMSRNLD